MGSAEGTAHRRGEDIATATRLTAPSGGAPASFAAKHRNDVGDSPYLDEIYVDFDMGDPCGAGRDITLSCGEYVTSPRGVDFEPFIHRAESGAQFYCQSLTSPPFANPHSFTIVRREWECLSTNKPKDPHIVVVHLWIRL